MIDVESILSEFEPYIDQIGSNAIRLEYHPEDESIWVISVSELTMRSFEQDINAMSPHHPLRRALDELSINGIEFIRPPIRDRHYYDPKLTQ